MELRDRRCTLESSVINSLSQRVRELLDQPGLAQVKIFAYGSLNEDKIMVVVREDADEWLRSRD
jgi:hypothetical protein